jgi:hypothetical protein
MFLGHVAVALAAKRAAPRASLGLLILAAELPDVIWALLLFLGVEHVRIAPGLTAVTPLDLYDYPISHSLALALGWGALLGLVYFMFQRYGRGAWVAFLVVLSHWGLDVLTHRPDMPLAPGLHLYAGLGLWNSLAATAAVELGLFVLGLLFYVNTTRATDGAGKYGFWILIVVLTGLQLMSYTGQAPPNLRDLAWAANGVWVFILWAGWVDSHRRVVSGVR